MMYTYREYKGDIADLNKPDAFKAVEREFNEQDRQNELAYQAILENYKELKRLAVVVYGDKSRQVKYLRDNPPPAPNRSKHKNELRKLLKKLDQHRALLKQRAYRRSLRERKHLAREALEKNGYTYGEHFYDGNVLKFAKTVLIELEPDVYAPRALPSGEQL